MDICECLNCQDRYDIWFVSSIHDKDPLYSNSDKVIKGSVDRTDLKLKH
jgi:hypothetical protein